MEPVEHILAEDQPLATIIRSGWAPSETTFLTPSHLNQQVGFVVYPSGGSIDPHTHRPIERRITGTAEVLVVRKGRCEVDLFDDDRSLVATRELRQGDILILIGGGHGFRMIEDTVLLEVKQGPYLGLDEKERF